MGRIVIVAFRPKPGHADELARLLRDHHPKLRAEGLVTGREPVQMVSADGTMVEVFEWASGAAIEAAHENADFVIVTNDDPYDEDEMGIIEQVCEGIDRDEGENFCQAA